MSLIDSLDCSSPFNDDEYEFEKEFDDWSKPKEGGIVPKESAYIDIPVWKSVHDGDVGTSAQFGDVDRWFFTTGGDWKEFMFGW